MIDLASATARTLCSSTFVRRGIIDFASGQVARRATSVTSMTILPRRRVGQTAWIVGYFQLRCDRPSPKQTWLPCCHSKLGGRAYRSDFTGRTTRNTHIVRFGYARGARRVRNRLQIELGYSLAQESYGGPRLGVNIDAGETPMRPLLAFFGSLGSCGD